MPIVVTDKKGQTVREPTINIRGGCCLGTLFFLVLAIYGLMTLIFQIIGALT